MKKLLLLLTLAGCQGDCHSTSAPPEDASEKDDDGLGLGLGLSSGHVIIQITPGLGINPATGGVEPSIGF